MAVIGKTYSVDSRSPKSRVFILWALKVWVRFDRLCGVVEGYERGITETIVLVTALQKHPHLAVQLCEMNVGKR